MASNFQPVNEALNEASGYIQKAIELSMDDIHGDPWIEKKYIDLWFQYAVNVSENFVTEAKKTENQHIVRIIKRTIIKNNRLLNIFLFPKFLSD